jgi:hypothetical protein
MIIDAMAVLPFVASAKGSTAIASMIIYVDGTQQYLVYAPSLDTYVNIGGGTHSIIVKAWDNWGGIYEQDETITVSGSSSSSGSGGVTVSSPSPGATVGSPVHFVANASGSAPISSMIVYVDDQQQYLTYNNSLDTNINVGAGSHSAIVKAWDNYGNIYQNSFNFTVSGTTTTSSASSSTAVTSGTNFWDIDQMSGWGDCTVCAGAGGNGPAAGYSLELYQGSPSIDGKSAKFSIWGSTPYADVLWWKQVNDGYNNAYINNNAHHFVYDTYFMVNDSNAVQALEFDINQFVNGHSLIFGTQCNVRSGNRWDIWDNVNNRWVGTGKYCSAPSAWTWHHVVVEVERASDGGDWLHYISIEMDGNKTYLDAWYAPTWTSWKGITVNFQMDGNYAMQPYTVWMDKFNLLTW